MKKLLILVVILFSITVANANIKDLLTDRTFLKDNTVICSSDNILNCSQEADGHHVYEKEMECPIGGEKFKGYFLGTHSTYGRHLDWEPVSYMRFPIPIPVCPSNGLVITQEKYNKDELEKLKKIVESKEYRDLYKEKHATYFLFAKMTELRKEEVKDIDHWWLYLNATWEADKCKNKKRYKQYALETISASKNKLAKLKDTSQEYWILKVITANMYRRIGDFKSAQDLIDNFGKPALKEKEANEYFLLALKLLQKAVKEKNIERIPIEDARNDNS